MLKYKFPERVKRVEGQETMFNLLHFDSLRSLSDLTIQELLKHKFPEQAERAEGHLLRTAKA
jgi:hypothetical protein